MNLCYIQSIIYAFCFIFTSSCFLNVFQIMLLQNILPIPYMCLPSMHSRNRIPSMNFLTISQIYKTMNSVITYIYEYVLFVCEPLTTHVLQIRMSGKTSSWPQVVQVICDNDAFGTLHSSFRITFVRCLHPLKTLTLVVIV